MKLPIRFVVATCLSAATVLLAPLIADAQTRRAVPVVRSRPVVVARSYYRPYFYDPWYFPYGYWYPRYYGYPFGYPYGYPYGYAYDQSGSLRLQVTPRQTEVFVDGYYAGTADDFDGVFQRLHVEPGDHDIELFLPGHRVLQQKIYLQPGRTFRLRHTMEPLAPGEAEPLRPEGAAAPRDNVPSRATPGRGPGRGAVDRSFGELSIRVQPDDAEVLIDGERWEGTADDERLVIQLGAGAHRIEIQKEGYRTYVTEIAVRGGETTTLNVALNKQ